MKMNKKGGFGPEILFAVSTMMGLTVLVLTMNLIYFEHLAPQLIDMLPDTDVGVQAENGINDFLRIWEFLPYIIMGLIMIFIIIVAVKKEPIEREF